MTTLAERLRADAEQRRRLHLDRHLRPRASTDGCLDLAGNDYLGLARDPRVTTAAAQAAQEWGVGATGSRLVTGTTSLHLELEAALAAFLGSDATLVFSSGYLANLAAITALAGEDTLLVCDAGNHASLIDAAKLARSRVVVVPHRDTTAVRRALTARAEPRALVVTDAAFSANGDLARVHDLHAACRLYGASLVVDEAHAIGVCGPGGRGLCVQAGIGSERDVVRTLTLSKALGNQGGVVAASAAVIERLVSAARPFIFDTALAPPSAAGALEALRVLRDTPALVDRVRARAQQLAAALRLPGPDAAIIPVLVGDAARAVAAAEECVRYGVRVGCFRPPSVPVGASRLRLTARANLTDADARRAARVITGALGRLA